MREASRIDAEKILTSTRITDQFAQTSRTFGADVTTARVELDTARQLLADPVRLLPADQRLAEVVAGTEFLDASLSALSTEAARLSVSFSDLAANFRAFDESLIRISETKAARMRRLLKALLTDISQIRDASTELKTVTTSLRERFTSVNNALAHIDVPLPNRRELRTLSARRGVVKFFELGAIDSLVVVLDGVTDMNILSNEVLPDTQPFEDAAFATVGSLLSGVYVSLPPLARGTLDTAGRVVGTIEVTRRATLTTLLTSYQALNLMFESLEAQTIGNPTAGCSEHVTSDGVHVFEGSRYADTCIGTQGVDIFHTYQGGDFVSGNGSGDQISLGSGPDTGHGNAGRDYLWGGLGEDRIEGEPGPDRLEDEASKGPDDPDRDEAFGEEGVDHVGIYDGDTEDVFWGGPGQDVTPIRNKDYDYYRLCAHDGTCYTFSDKVNL